MADDTANDPASNPLLGTNTFQSIDNVEKYPLRGPINHVCYTSLLHTVGPESAGNSQKSAKNGSINCYTRLLHNVPIGLCVRAGRFYYRRRVPHDVRQLTGRAEIWRSLQTDSLKSALRRLHLVASQIEADFEHARLKMGLAVDQALLQPVSIDFQQVSAPPTKSVTLGDAYQRYMNDPTHSWSARTREAYETSRKLAVSVISHIKISSKPSGVKDRYPKIAAC